MKGIIVLFLAFGLLAAWGGVPAVAGGALDGKSFTGEIGKQGAEKGDKDEFIFKDGKFRSIACDPYGFGDGPYTAALSDETVTFEAETVSPTDGTMKWKGTVKENTLEGTSSWFRPGQAPVEHWIKAELEQ